MNYTFRDCRSRSTSQAYCVTLAQISNIANYLKYNYYLDCDAIDNVTLRLWKFSDFCSRHTVGVAGDDIMFHILVFNENVMISIKISLKFVLKVQINNKKNSSIGSDSGLAPTRRQAIIWTNDGPFTDAYMRHSASMS